MEQGKNDRLLDSVSLSRTAFGLNAFSNGVTTTLSKKVIYVVISSAILLIIPNLSLENKSIAKHASCGSQTRVSHHSGAQSATTWPPRHIVPRDFCYLKGLSPSALKLFTYFRQSFVSLESIRT